MSDKWENAVWTSDGSFDLEATIEEARFARITRNVPPNPPPAAVRQGGLDGKAIARIAVSDCIDCGSWKNSAVMQFLIDSANRKNGACYPSNETIARATNCTERTVQRATRWWRRHGYEINGKIAPFLSIAAKGQERSDGTKESNAYHIGWEPLIVCARNHHYRARVRVHAKAILANPKRQMCRAGDDRCVAEGTTDVSS
jgi:hypothetical protein